MFAGFTHFLAKITPERLAVKLECLEIACPGYDKVFNFRV